MRALGVFSLSTIYFVVSTEGVSFSPAALFGVRAGGTIDGQKPSREPERTESAVWKAVTSVEEKVQEIVANEVETLFHGHEEDQKADVVDKAKKAITKSAEEIKSKKVQDHLSKASHDAQPHNHKDSQILQAVEAAEKAVLHAIEEEVDTLFKHDHDHADDQVVKDKAKKTVKAGIEKAKKKVEDHHERRRNWLDLRHEVTFEEYSHFMGI